MFRRMMLVAGVCLIALAIRSAGGLADTPPDNPEQRAAAFLSAEVPQWFTENRCYSCHNNGDAVRALAGAVRSGITIKRQPLADTLAFLASPDRWDTNGPDGPFKDTKLARIQFAAALAAAHRAGLVDKASLAAAARLVAELQAADGHWNVDVQGAIGSPTTYGPAVASWLAIETLEAAGCKAHSERIARATGWFETHKIGNLLDAAAALVVLARVDTSAAQTQRERALVLVRDGQAANGGWGPFANAPPEVFDTALVVLALAAQKQDADTQARIARGRAFLTARQLDDGSWPATTRPPGADSYAQRISTTAWALMALGVANRKE